MQVVVEDKEKDDKSKGIVALDCHACEITWAHQRRKRRENLGKVFPQEKTGDCPSGCVDEAATQLMEDNTSAETETQTVSEGDATNIEETLTSSDFCKSQLTDSQECPSTSVKNDTQQGENVSRPLVSFMVRVGAGAEIANDLSRDGVVLEMTWIDGQNKNDLYQLFQFFQNKLLKGF